MIRFARPLCAFALAAALATVGAADDRSKGDKKSGSKGQVDSTPEPFGRPDGMKPGNVRHWYVWYANKTWHIRTTTKMQRHKFEGSIEAVGGKFTDMVVPKADPVGPNRDGFAWNKKKTVFFINFTTDGAMDGMDLQCDDKVTDLKFKLLFDGNPAPVKQISIGAGNDHPTDNEFSLPAWPKAAKKK